MAAAPIRARDLPGLRDDTVRGLRAHAENMRARDRDPLTRQAMLARGHDMTAAAAATDTIAQHLRVASLWYVTSDMTDVALDASRDLPDWTPAQAVPDDAGLLIWEGGMPGLAWPGAAPEGWVDAGIGPRPPVVTLDGVLWSLFGGHLRVHLLTLGANVPTEALQDYYQATPLVEIGEVGDAAGDGIVRGISTDRPGDDGPAAAVLAAVAATWLLMGQETLADRTALTPAPKVSAAYRRARRPDPVVSIVDLRRARTPNHDDDQQDATRRHLIHRHVVRGHWRQQPCGPELAQRRPTWIAPFVKGPDGAPFVRSEVVRVWRR